MFNMLNSGFEEELMNNRRSAPRLARLGTTAALLAFAVLVTGCGGANAPSTAAAGEEPAGSQEGDFSIFQAGMLEEVNDGEPVAGGNLRIAGFTEPTSLDPAEILFAGTNGANEMMAVFDILMRWDIESGELVPQLAESLTTNDDSTEWTLKLREGVQFSDGSPLDGDAVKWSIERYIENKGTESGTMARNVASIDVQDPVTVVFTLTTPWGGFGNLLASGPGVIVAESSDKGGTFEPIGAGPFKLESYAPQEALNLVANPDYWDGAPFLDGVEFVYLNDQLAALDSLKSGSVHVTNLSQPHLVKEAMESGFGGYNNIISVGNIALINANDGRPGADPRVRQALQLGLNTELIIERAFEGAGSGATDVFTEYSMWHTDVEPLGYDPDRARELVEAAKADGFDGKIVYTSSQDPTSRAVSLAIKASLDSVGFDVEVDALRNSADVYTRIAIERDYDVAGWGISLRDSDPYTRMFAALHSEGSISHGVHTGPEMDAIIDDFQAATSQEEALEVMVRFQEQWKVDVPAITWGPKADFWTWDTELLRGVMGSGTSSLVLAKAWLSK